ncbi:MAG: glycosyltransferase, partial [Sciscionella sp.]
MSTAGVLTVLVCHNGEQWLPDVLEALEAQTVRSRYILAVDTGSVDETAEILTEPLAEHLLDGVITLDADTGFGAAVAVALNTAAQRWEYPGSWVWLLHDDCAPEPDCLATLLAAAEGGRSVGIVGPLALDWSDSRLVVGAGVSTDASGHRQTGLTRDELDWSRFDRQLAGRRFGADTEVLAVGSAGALVRRALWEELGGYDRDLPLFGDDVDFCWRVNHAGRAVLFVPRARVRHVRAASLRLRDTAALGNGEAPAAGRSHGLRTYLANCGRGAYLLGLPRLVLLCLLRGIGFTLLRRTEEAGVELRALGYLLRGGNGLRAARRERKVTARGGTVSGLFTTRFTRLRNAFRAVASSIEQRRVLSDATLGRLPGDGEPCGTRIVPDAELVPIPPAEPPAANSAKHSPVIGLRRPATSVVFVLPDQPVLEAPPVPRQTADAPAPEDQAPEDQADELHTDDADAAESEGAESEDAVSAEVAGEPDEQPAEPADTVITTDPTADTLVTTEPATRSKHLLRRRLRPYAVRSDDPRSADADLMLVTVSRRRVLADIVLAPPVLLVVALAAVSLVAGAERLGGFLAGGRLLPLQSLAATWSSYLAAWHSVAGGTAAPAPAALAVLGILGAPFAPIGGPAAAVTTLLLADPPLAGLFAYLVSRRMPVSRVVRALAATGYALLPPAVTAVGQGRLDAVVVHILLPLVLAGIVGVLTQRRRRGSGTAWLSFAVVTAIGLAVIGAFSPLVHLLLLLVALVGFV